MELDQKTQQRHLEWTIFALKIGKDSDVVSWNEALCSWFDVGLTTGDSTSPRALFKFKTLMKKVKQAENRDNPHEDSVFKTYSLITREIVHRIIDKPMWQHQKTPSSACLDIRSETA